ncbi:hypothetical protein NHP21005_14060 [Helicobacter sp. NHP21005]|uniref:hypothetical protein n=1 Tax=Helicobacter felistomachi TaxID=3040201 RepID=UPI0025732AAA|nr:hypothetical protein [Helicobacter sp. NHP21005]BEG57718.1 hypothetical protein NHP21005_14060 [Helicobacter sp. NHP21005]
MGKEDNNRDVHEDLRKLFTMAVINAETLKDERVMQTPTFQEAIENIVQIFEDFAATKIQTPDELLEKIYAQNYPIDIYNNTKSFGDTFAYCNPSALLDTLQGGYSFYYTFKIKIDFAEFVSEIFTKAENKFLESEGGTYTYDEVRSCIRYKTGDFLTCVAEEMRWEHMGY